MLLNDGTLNQEHSHLEEILKDFRGAHPIDITVD